MLKLPKKYLILSGIIVICCMSVGLYLYENYYYPSTDDAYANANIVYISSQVQGQVAQVYVIDHQEVAQGTLLFTLDKTPFIEAYNQAQAEANVAKEQLLADQDAIHVAEALLAQDQANLVYQQKQYQRIIALVKKDFASEEQGDAALNNLKRAEASVQSDTAALAQAKQNLIVQGAEVKAAEANLANANTNLGYTEIYATVNGKVSNITLRPGAVVTPGTNLFALIDQNSYWVDANFKETELRRIHPGLKATVVFDMYPAIKFNGQVQSISGGSGAVFSLLPPENATGNWVKVTQRFPVRILIPASQLQTNYPLRVGASAEVTINTKNP